MLASARPLMLMPLFPLASTPVPATFVPISLPSITFPLVLGDVEVVDSSIPSVEFPDMTLRVAAVVPPTVLPVAPWIKMPTPLGSADEPVASVPISFLRW